MVNGHDEAREDTSTGKGKFIAACEQFELLQYREMSEREELAEADGKRRRGLKRMTADCANGAGINRRKPRKRSAFS